MSSPLIRPRLARTLAAAVGVAALVAACGAGEKGAAQDASVTRAGATATAGVAKAKEQMAALDGAPSWPDFTKLSQSPDVKGRKFTYVAFGDQVPVIHGIGVGVQQALGAAGATVNICDGKFNPTAVASCLKTAGDEKVDGVITSFVDYQMAGPAFEALVGKGVKVIVAGVAPSGGRKADKNLAFYDNTPRVFKLHEALSTSAVALGGEQTNVIWARLMDSTTTQTASKKGIAKFKELCPSCGIATTEFTTVNVDKLGSAVSAALVANPKTNAVIVPVDSYVPPVLQGIQSAGFAGKVKVISSSSDLAGLQRVKAGQQASDLGTPVLYEGWRFAHAMMQLLAGDEVTKGEEFVSRNFTSSNVSGLDLGAQKYLSDDWFGGGAYRDKFLAAWGQS
ncbi:sugar ABC transporter substrate-binding protein [Pedococcus sp. 5OH_020]|uniref:sugar ABC transporter substrate-binding protein n=1 Tax=Pedococcus sp. 5OH_020 TaxID=2989814 RepID=UPI0022E9EB1B|nr:substrate-binding domain-containing protein [Pedococcus sp. 5OH_020]